MRWRDQVSSKAARAVAAIAGFACVCVLTLLAVERLDTRLAKRPSAAATAHIAGKVLAGDDWNERIRSETFWDGRPGREIARESAKSEASGSWGDWGPGGAARNGRPRAAAPSTPRSYRTVCVRLCDGYMYPINFATPSGNLERDAAQCERSCSSPARLFTQRSGSEDASDLVDLKGQPYSALKTANLFRSKYDESCKCKPHPWEQAALDRHRIHALEARRDKASAAVVAELTELRSKMRQATIAERIKTSGEPKLAQSGKRRPGATQERREREATPAAMVSIIPAVDGPDLPGDPGNAGVSEAPLAQLPARSRTTRAASNAREGIMRLGSGESPRPARRTASASTARPAGDWVGRAFGHN